MRHEASLNTSELSKKTALSIPKINKKFIWNIKSLKNRYFLYLVSIICFYIIWDITAINHEGMLPRPIEVVHRLEYMYSHSLAGKTLIEHLAFSLRRVFIGFIIAACIGIPLGLLMGFNKYIRAIVKPIFDIMKPMPPIAWISLAILWFGIGETSKVFIIVIGAIVPVVINSFNGIRLVDPALYDVVKVLGGNRWDEIVQVSFSASLPAIFAGMQISLSTAWTTVLAAELVGAREGMGFIIIQGMNLSRPDQIVGGMLVIAATAWVISAVMNLLERWLCPWKVEVQ